MTSNELETLLDAQPLRRLHWLARRRIHRHFRMGKERLIDALLRLPPESRAEVEVDLQTLIHQSEGHPVPSQKSHSGIQKKDQVQRSRKVAPNTQQGEVSTAAGVTIGSLLEGIGVPTPAPFHPDAWQEEAASCLETSDVIVSVPTGSGKTYVAIEATKRAMDADRTVIYTSPLKALSNTKFTEFVHLFGADRVGILTGDRRDNSQAPLLIMTTEILRNLLYDAASGEIDVRLDTLGLVILDESQYIADPERGVVWEETIIFCPSQARLLMLSASIGNPDEVAAWMTSIRSVPCHLIQHRKRSVPLRAGYLYPTGRLTPLFTTKEIVQGRHWALHPDAQRLSTQYEEETLGIRARRSK